MLIDSIFVDSVQKHVSFVLLSASDCTIAGVTLLNIHSAWQSLTTRGVLHKLKSQLVCDTLRMIVKPAFEFVNKI